jgi:hypothetical protein
MAYKVVAQDRQVSAALGEILERLTILLPIADTPLIQAEHPLSEDC